jgi:hypothetical protein
LTGDRDEDRHALEERAGILEYDADMSRNEAEASAARLLKSKLAKKNRTGSVTGH